MIQTVVQVEGMACGMCEAHVNDAIRASFKVKKVTSSHAKKETVILSDAPLDETALREVIVKAGYTAGDVTSQAREKKGLFGLGRK